MARALQSASLSFGLVNIPVKLYPAAKSKSVSFHLLHRPDGSRIQEHFYCPVDKREVSRDEIVKGYEVSRNHYVEITNDELKAMEEAANRNVEIQEFVPLDAIDPVYFEKTYYLGPDKGGEKPYRLLAEALSQRNRGAVAKFVMRGKENLVLLRPADDAHLVLDVMYYADEVKNIREIDVPLAKIKDAELKLAQNLIDSLSNDKWQPDKYRDTYRDRVLDLVKKKDKGQEVVAPPPVGEGQAQVIDLMDALKKSLARRPHGKEKPGTARAKRKETPLRKVKRAAGS
jgi:DNA end-binding protein Ku